MPTALTATPIWIFFVSIGCAICFSFCDSFAGHWGKTGSMRALLITIVAAPLSYLSFGYLNSRLDLARAGGLVNSLIVIFTTAVAVFIFKESLTWMQYLGVGLIVVGIYLMMTK